MLLPTPTASALAGPPPLPPMAGHAPPPPLEQACVPRRAVFAALLSASAAAAVPPAFAAPSALKLEATSDGPYGVSFSVPEGWDQSTQRLPDGRKLSLAVGASFPTARTRRPPHGVLSPRADPQDKDANVVAVYTPLAPDYTSLGSFGTIDYVASTLLPQCGGTSCTLDKDGVTGTMLEQVTKKGSYVYTYEIEQLGQPTRRLRTLFSVLLEEGRGKILFTLTGQAATTRFAELRPTFDAVVDSYSAKSAAK